MSSMRNLRASISWALPLPKPPRKPRRLPRKSPRARRLRLLLRRRGRLHRLQRLLLFQLRLLPWLRDLLLRLPLELQLSRRLLLLASRVPASFRRCGPLALPQVRLPRLRLQYDLARLRRPRGRGLVCRCVPRRPVHLRLAFLTQLPGNPALLPRNVRRLRLRRRRLEPQLPGRRDPRVRRRAGKDFRRRVRRRSPAKGIRGKDPVHRKVCVLLRLRVGLLVPAVRRDRAVLRVPVVLPEDFRNVPAAQAAVPDKLPSAASVPAQPLEAFPRPSRASRCMRASRPPRVGVHSSRSALPKANAGCILCARVQVRVRAARSSNQLRPFSASRAKLR